ncbi:hypothetical protein C8Q76DRAFT_788686 [Earliella scabrosa]|nr:hypothetical protein C8Q76DRAFT_788686 [Earliella scabrosa]
MLSRLRSSSAVTVYIPPAVYSAGSTIAGEVEVDFRQLQEEKIEEVHVRIRGSAKTWVHRDRSNYVEEIKLVCDELQLWQRGGTLYPPAGEDVLRLPFAFALPKQLPPSFDLRTVDKTAWVRYAVSAIGVRRGFLALNKKHHVPLAVLPHDALGARIRAEGATHALRTAAKEERIRKGLWGDYGRAEVEVGRFPALEQLAIPNIPVLPLFSDIPYTITVRTTSAPIARSKAEAHPPDKPFFPPVPASAHDVEFTVQRDVRIRAQYMVGSASETVAHFLGGKAKQGGTSKSYARPPVDVEVPQRVWLSLDANGEPVVEGEEKGKEKQRAGGSGGDADAKGVWAQRATFHSTFKLSCAPAFSVHNIDCAYQLVVKVPFPGVGNNVKLEVPVTITSGIDQPLPRDQTDGESDDPPPILDLPPAYWDANDKDWGDDEK